MGNLLNGLNIIDLSTHLPGPFCSKLLADLGAHVTRVVHPHKKDAADEFHGSYGEYLNGQKQKIALDLKNESDRQKFYQLVKGSDVVLHAFRPQVMARLGFEFETLERLNPKIILCSISGYAHDSPLRDRAGHDQNFLALLGVLSLCETPSLPPLPIADLCVSWQAALEILAAVIERIRTGQGKHVNPSIVKSVDLAQGIFIQQYRDSGAIPSGGRLFSTGLLFNYQIYETSDGRYFSVAPLEPHFLQKFVALIDCPELLEKRLSDEEKKQILRTTFKKHTFDFWRQKFSSQDCCVEPVLEYGERKELDHSLDI